MKKYLFMAALLIFSLTGLGAECQNKGIKLRADKDETTVQAGATTPFTAAPRKVRDDDHGFSIVVPTDWKVTKTQGNPALFAQAPGAGPNGPLINVVVEDISQRMAPADYLRANILTMQASLPGLEIEDARMEVSAGVTMAWIKFRFPRGDEPVEAIAYCQTRDYRAFVVTGIGPAKDVKQNEPIFRYIARSLRID